MDKKYLGYSIEDRKWEVFGAGSEDKITPENTGYDAVIPYTEELAASLGAK
jgi:hypothetical protein